MGKDSKDCWDKRRMGCSRLESADLSCRSPREDLPLAWRQDQFQGHRSGPVELDGIRPPRDVFRARGLGGQQGWAGPGHAEGPAGVRSKAVLGEEAVRRPYKVKGRFP